MDETFSNIQQALSATGLARETSAHLVRCCGILDQHPRHAVYVIKQLPEISTLDRDDLTDIWRALSAPSVGVPEHSQEKREHLKGVQKFLGSLKSNDTFTWANRLALLMMEAGTLPQYAVAMEALDSDDQRLVLVERLMNRAVGNAVKDPAGHMPVWRALCEQLRAEWGEDPQIRDAWRWAWLRGCLRNEQATEDSIEAMDQTLGALEQVGVSIHEPGGDGLDLLKSHLTHHSTKWGEASCAVVSLLLNRGADFSEVIDWELSHPIRRTLEDHPAVRRARLGEVTSLMAGGAPGSAPSKLRF